MCEEYMAYIDAVVEMMIEMSSSLLTRYLSFQTRSWTSSSVCIGRDTSIEEMWEYRERWDRI
jgi:hypothetical protein